MSDGSISNVSAPAGRVPAERLLACPECDLLQTVPRLAAGESARCVRCTAVLLRNPVGSLERSLALLATAAVLYLLANLSPMVGLEMQGQRVEVSLFGAVRILWSDGSPVVAGLVFLTAILFPVLEMAMLGLMLLQLRLGGRRRGFPVLFRLMRSLQPWGMVEVLLLGLLVSLVKLSHLAEVILGAAFWALAMLIAVLAAAARSFEPRLLWDGPERAVRA